jgi:hypothetical protein
MNGQPEVYDFNDNLIQIGDAVYFAVPGRNGGNMKYGVVTGFAKPSTNTYTHAPASVVIKTADGTSRVNYLQNIVVITPKAE